MRRHLIKQAEDRILGLERELGFETDTEKREELAMEIANLWYDIDND